MTQDQHYVPQVYLRQWCDGHTLIRYRRVGPEAKLEMTKKVPKSVAFERDLYTLPDGGVANGLSGNGLEDSLARNVEERFAEIAASVAALSDRIDDVTIEQNIRWLMQTFAARSPRTISRVEDGVSEFIASQRPTIDALMKRANTQASRAELRKFQDARLPKVAARAGVAAVVARGLPKDVSWLDGDVHVVRAEKMKGLLSAMGAGEFVTFEDPVVEWTSCSFDLLASFTLSPATLVLVLPRGGQITHEQLLDVVMRHVFATAAHRENLFARTEVSGQVLLSANTLRATATKSKRLP